MLTAKLRGRWQCKPMNSHVPSYHGYRFPPEIISHAVWLYHRFGVSFRDVEDLLAQRGITVTYETIRQWCQTFGPAYARTRRRRRGRMGDTWYLDELFLRLQGRRQGSVNLAERSWVLAGGGPGLAGLRDTRHRVPLGERSGAEPAVMGSPQHMAPDPEEILHHAVNRGEPLEMSDRREAAHLAFTLSGAFM